MEDIMKRLNTKQLAFNAIAIALVMVGITYATTRISDEFVNTTGTVNASVLQGQLNCGYLAGNTSDLCTLADTNTNCDGNGECTNVFYSTNLTDASIIGINSSLWTNVTITESQISDLSHTVDTTIGNCSGDGSCAQVFYQNNNTNAILQNTHNHSCLNLTGGSDGDFCADADTGGAGANFWVDAGAYIFPNTSFADNVAIIAGYINATDWTNVTITESQISDLSHTTDTDTNVTSICSTGNELLLQNGSCVLDTVYLDNVDTTCDSGDQTCTFDDDTINVTTAINTTVSVGFDSGLGQIFWNATSGCFEFDNTNTGTKLAIC